MSAENTYVNEFVARGIVLAIGRNEYHSRVLTLLVQERRNNTLKLEITLEDGAARGIDKKDRVVVNGYTRGFSYHNDALGKDSEVMFFVGTDVQRDTTELAKRFGGNVGTFYPEPLFRSFVAGRIVAVTSPSAKNHWAKLTVETSGGGSDLRASHVILRYFCGGRLPVFDYQAGDTICSRLSAYTPEKEINGRTVRFQNLNVEDIAYLSKVPRAAEKKLGLDVDLGLNRQTVLFHSAGKPEKPAGPVESFVDTDGFADDTDLFNESL